MQQTKWITLVKYNIWKWVGRSVNWSISMSFTLSPLLTHVYSL